MMSNSKLMWAAVLLLAGIRLEAQNVPKVTKEPTVYKGVTDNACAVEVAFGSYGSGIDPKAFDKVMKLIETCNVKYTSTNIGREGETRICLPLNDVKRSEKKSIIKRLKKIAKEGQLVSVSIR